MRPALDPRNGPWDAQHRHCKQERTGLANRKSFWFSLSVDYPSTPKVTKYGWHLDDPNDWCEGKTGSLSELDTSTSSAYCYDAETKKLYLKIVSTGFELEELEIKPAS